MKKLWPIIFILTSLIFSSCSEETVTKTVYVTEEADTETEPDSVTDSDAVVDDEEDDLYPEGEGSGSNYYTFRPIIGHGLKNEEVSWSSTMLEDNQSLFVTDNRLNVRIIVRDSPGKGFDSQGEECTQLEMNYTKLSVEVGVRSYDSDDFTDGFDEMAVNYTYLERHTFDEVDVDSASSTHSFSVPTNSSDAPFALDILNVEWDWNCNYDKENGNQGYGCPVMNVNYKDCWEVELQVATSYTKDFP